jgi:hypothetical protein
MDVFTHPDKSMATTLIRIMLNNYTHFLLLTPNDKKDSLLSLLRSDDVRKSISLLIGRRKYSSLPGNISLR